MMMSPAASNMTIVTLCTELIGSCKKNERCDVAASSFFAPQLAACNNNDKNNNTIVHIVIYCFA